MISVIRRMILWITAALLVGTILDGCVLYYCWVWFISPALKVPAVSGFIAVGLVLTSRMLLFKPPYQQQYIEPPSKYEDSPGDYQSEVMKIKETGDFFIEQQWIWVIIKPVVIFICALCVHYFTS